MDGLIPFLHNPPLSLYLYDRKENGRLLLLSILPRTPLDSEGAHHQEAEEGRDVRYQERCRLDTARCILLLQLTKRYIVYRNRTI
jgi:hypothetical protein